MVHDVQWLVKDFDVLYNAALDVSESVVESAKETPPQRVLRAQLARLRPAFDLVQRMKSERESGPRAVFFWRGDAQALTAEIAHVLSLSDLQEVACEMALAWRGRSRAAQRAAKPVAQCASCGAGLADGNLCAECAKEG